MGEINDIIFVVYTGRVQIDEDEKAVLKEARKRPIVFDKDCPETTPERALKFRRVNPPRSQVGKGA